MIVLAEKRLAFRTRSDRLRYAVLFRAREAKRVNATTKQLRAVLARQMSAVASTYESTGNDTYALSRIEQFRRPIEQIMQQAYFKTAFQFGGYMIRNESLTAKKDLFTDALAIDEELTFWSQVDVWAKTTAARKVQRINESTRDFLRRTIHSGIADGLSQVGVAETIYEHIDGIGFWSPYKRGNMIARTEIHAAANYATTEAVKYTGIETFKRWLNNPERSRDAHIEADGQMVEMTEKFTVWGEPLDFPGDPNGRAENIINCKCCLEYPPKE